MQPVLTSRNLIIKALINILKIAGESELPCLTSLRPMSLNVDNRSRCLIPSVSVPSVVLSSSSSMLTIGLGV